MKAYSVCLSTTIVVVAESEDAASAIARQDLPDICWNNEIDVRTVTEITSISRLPHGWSGKSIPYGGDDETPLAQILPPEGK